MPVAGWEEPVEVRLQQEYGCGSRRTAAGAVNHAQAAKNLRVDLRGHHAPPVLQRFILYMGLGEAPPWLLGTISYSTLVVSGPELVFTLSLLYHLLEIPSPSTIIVAELSGLYGSVTQTFISSGKSHPSGWKMATHTCSQLQWGKGMPADAKVDQKVAHTLRPGPIMQTVLLPLLPGWWLLACWLLDTNCLKCFGGRSSLDFRGCDCGLWQKVIIFKPSSPEWDGTESTKSPLGKSTRSDFPVT